MIQSPQSFVVSQECQKVGWQNGYRRALGEADGWARYGSTTAKGTVWFAAGGTDGQIDALVYELYGLTPEEIAVVEAGGAD